MALKADVVAVEIQARIENARRNIGNYESSFSAHMANIRRQAGMTEVAVEGHMQGTADSVRRMSSSVRQAVAALAIGMAGREVIQYADAWTEAGNKIAAAGTPIEQQQGRLKDLAALAIETRSEFSATATLYARMGIATQELADQSFDLLRVTELVNKAFVAGGASQQERRSGIIQLSQAMASGVLQGEELRALRESAPLLMQAIAREYGTTIGGLKKLGEEGQLTTERIITAIMNGASDIEGRFSKTNTTIGDSFTNLKTRVIEYIGLADDSRGATETLAGAIGFVADNVAAFADALMIAAAAAGAIGGASLAKYFAAEAAQMGKTIAAHNMRIVALRAERKFQLETAQATVVAQKARQAEIVTTQAQVAATLELALAQKASALGYVELQLGLAKAGLATGQLETAQATLAAQSRNVIRLQGIQRGLSAELAAAHAAEAIAAGTASVRQGQYAGVVARTGVAARAAAAGVTVMRGAMALVGGPVGVALLAAAAAFYMIDKNARDAAKRVEDLRTASENVRRSLVEAREVMAGSNAPLKQVGDDAADSAGKVFDLTKSVNELTKGMQNLRQEGQISAALKLGGDIDALDKQIAEGEAARNRFIAGRSVRASVGRKGGDFGPQYDETEEGKALLKAKQDRAAAANQMRFATKGLTLEDVGRQWREGSGGKPKADNSKLIEQEKKVIEGLMKSLDDAKATGVDAAAKRLGEEIATAHEVIRLLEAGLDEDTARDFAKDKSKADKKGGKDKSESDDLRNIKAINDAWDNSFLTKRQLAEKSYQDDLAKISGLTVAQSQKDSLALQALQVRDEAISNIAKDEMDGIEALLDARDKALGKEKEIIDRKAAADKKAAQERYRDDAAMAQQAVDLIEAQRVADIKVFNDQEAADKKELLDDMLALRAQALGDYESLAQMEYDALVAQIEKELTAETGKYEALAALEEGHAETVKAIRERMRDERLREAVEDARTMGEGFRAQWDVMRSESETALADIGALFADTFGPGGTIQESIGDAAGRAIAFGDDFTESMEDAARAIASDLISALVQYGVQLAVQQALGIALGSSAVAATAAQAAATAAAWAPAAAAASLATLGGNAAPASAALASVHALSAALSRVPGFAKGVVDLKGPGTGTSDSINARLSKGESVITADATRKNRSILKAMNNGANVEAMLSRINQPAVIDTAFAGGRSRSVSVGGSNLYFNGPVNDETVPVLQSMLERRDRELEGRIERVIARDRTHTTPRHKRKRFFGSK